MSISLRLAGFELRDSIGYAADTDSAPLLAWVYGSGFPKSLDISKAIDKQAGAEREVIGSYIASRDYTRNGIKGDMAISSGSVNSIELPITAPATPDAQLWHGWGTGLKPAWEPIIVACKPLDGTYANNALTWGVAGYNIDGARIGTETIRSNGEGANGLSKMHKDQGDRPYKNGIPGKPMPSTHIGRWPANLILGEEAAQEMDRQSGYSKSSDKPRNNGEFKSVAKGYEYAHTTYGHSDSGGASRFFYTAKASRAERAIGVAGLPEYQVDDSREPDAPGANNPRNRGGRQAANHHPTVKPIKLMRYLAKLTSTPTGGIVLDPYMGSGTTGIACILEGREFVGIEIAEDYFAIAQARISHFEGMAQLDRALLDQEMADAAEEEDTEEPDAAQSTPEPAGKPLQAGLF